MTSAKTPKTPFKKQNNEFSDTFYYSSELKRVAELKNATEKYTMTDERTSKGDRIYIYELTKGEKTLFTSKAIELTSRRTRMTYYAVYKNPEEATQKEHQLTENETELLSMFSE